LAGAVIGAASDSVSDHPDARTTLPPRHDHGAVIRTLSRLHALPPYRRPVGSALMEHGRGLFGTTDR
jgi:hypothetical protein